MLQDHEARIPILLDSKSLKDRPRATFHDPLAAAAIFAPDLLRTAGRVEVELAGRRPDAWCAAAAE